MGRVELAEHIHFSVTMSVDPGGLHSVPNRTYSTSSFKTATENSGFYLNDFLSSPVYRLLSVSFSGECWLFNYRDRDLPSSIITCSLPRPRELVDFTTVSSPAICGGEEIEIQRGSVVFQWKNRGILVGTVGINSNHGFVLEVTFPVVHLRSLVTHDAELDDRLGGIHMPTHLPLWQVTLERTVDELAGQVRYFLHHLIYDTLRIRLHRYPHT